MFTILAASSTLSTFPEHKNPLSEVKKDGNLFVLKPLKYFNNN
jgi:hypothetical protein